MVVPLCSCHYTNSDPTGIRHKRWDALGPKVQHSTNNKLYSLFAGRVQPGRASPRLRYGVKSWQTHQGFFLFIVLWQTMALKMVFENHSLFMFINKRGITWQWHTQCDHPIRGVVKHWELPKSIQFSGCLQEISSLALAYLWFLEFSRFSQRRGWAGTSHWKGSRLCGESVPFLSEGG